MADRLYRAQVTIPLDSGIPDDAIVNTFHFDDDDDPVAGPEDTHGWIADELQAFYNAFDNVLFPSSVAGDATLRLYDLRDPEPRVPRHTGVFGITPAAASPLPTQIALCLSFAADPQSGVNPQRRRGRVYLGPIAVTAAEVVNAQLRPTAAAMDAVRGAAEAMMAGFLHPGSPGLHLQWAIYSPTTDIASSIDDAFNDVTSGWVDNTFDTQRRRCPEASLRVTF